MKTNTAPNDRPTLQIPADTSSPRFFLDSAYDAGTDDCEWWLDLGRIDLPSFRTCNSFSATPQP